MVEVAVEYTVGYGTVKILGVRIPSSVYVGNVFNVMREENRKNIIGDNG